MNITLRILSGIPGLGLMIFGALCTAYVFHDFAPVGGNLPWATEGQFSAAVGLLFEVAKMALMMAAIVMFSMRKWIVGLIASASCIVLVTISMFTTHQFVSSYEKSNTQTASSEVVAIQSSIEAIESEILMVKEGIQENIHTAERYDSFDRVTDRNEVLEKNSELRSEIRELNDQKAVQMTKLVEAKDKAVESTPVQKLFYILIAIMLDLIGMLCWAIATWRPVPPTAQKRLSKVSSETSEPYVSMEMPPVAKSELSHGLEQQAESLDGKVSDTAVDQPNDEVIEDQSSDANTETPHSTYTENVFRIDAERALRVERNAQEKASPVETEVKESTTERRSDATIEKQEDASTEISDGLTDDERNVVAALKRGEIQPKKAEVRQFLQVGDKKAQEMMKSLLDKGELKKEGRFYALADAS